MPIQRYRSIDEMLPEDFSYSPEVLYGLWGEAANDPGGWTALLNTYRKIGNGDIEKGMQRASSAVRKRSEQYTRIADKFPEIASNDFELGRLQKMIDTVHGFVPDETWDRYNHEAPGLYAEAAKLSGRTPEQQMLWTLSPKWSDVDLNSGVRYGNQVYFKKKAAKNPRTNAMSIPDSDVKTLQMTLSNAGIDVGPIDGKMGPKTRAGIKQFQLRSKLTPDGLVGPKTRRALQLQGSK